METHLRDLATRQARTVSVSVIVANNLAHSDVCEIDGVRLERVARFATIASMPLCPGLLSAIRRSPSDLVHIHMPNPGAALAFLMSGHTGKVVITHHADTIGRRLLRRFSDPFVTRIMERASRIIVTSSRYLNSSAELEPFYEKCRVVPLGIDIQDAACADHKLVQRLRRQFGDRLILAVGRLVPYKGFDVLIQAMKHVEARLLLIGTGPQHDSLARLVATEGLEKKIEIVGRVENVAPYFAAASIFVLPSVTRAEAFGLVQLEAMAAGLPIINTDIESGVPEVSVDGKTGLTVPPRDATALSKAISLLLERKDLRERFGDAARVKAKAEYTADLMTSRTFKVYEEILGGSGDLPLY
jgi:rhamnosyl/mannosyltransferase